MAKVFYSNGIDYISGALNKVKKGGQHDHEKMLLATHRKAATTSTHCNRIYLREVSVRTSPLSTKELQAERAADLMAITQDQIDFLAQKDAANGKKTMKAYLWKVCGQEYDAQQG